MQGPTDGPRLIDREVEPDVAVGVALSDSRSDGPIDRRQLLAG